MKNNFIENFLSLKNYEENRLDRRKQVLGAASKNDTAEFFTPYSIVKRMADKIPEEDWSDDRVKTDEGLLEVCGCPKDKCKEYAEYCKNTIDKVDKK